MTPRALALFAQVLLFSACIPPQSPGALGEDADPEENALTLAQKIQSDPQGLVREVAAARELTVHRQVPFIIDDDATFTKSVHKWLSCRDERLRNRDFHTA